MFTWPHTGRIACSLYPAVRALAALKLFLQKSLAWPITLPPLCASRGGVLSRVRLQTRSRPVCRPLHFSGRGAARGVKTRNTSCSQGRGKGGMRAIVVDGWCCLAWPSMWPPSKGTIRARRNCCASRSVNASCASSRKAGPTCALSAAETCGAIVCRRRNSPAYAWTTSCCRVRTRRASSGRWPRPTPQMIRPADAAWAPRASTW